MARRRGEQGFVSRVICKIHSPSIYKLPLLHLQKRWTDIWYKNAKPLGRGSWMVEKFISRIISIPLPSSCRRRNLRKRARVQNVFKKYLFRCTKNERRNVRSKTTKEHGCLEGRWKNYINTQFDRCFVMKYPLKVGYLKAVQRWIREIVSAILPVKFAYISNIIYEINQQMQTTRVEAGWRC